MARTANPSGRASDTATSSASSRQATKISEPAPLDRDRIVDAILRWLALCPPRWASQYVLALQPHSSTAYRSALEPLLDRFDPSSRDTVRRALADGQSVLLPLATNAVLRDLTYEALSKPRADFERMMHVVATDSPAPDDTALTRQQVDNLALMTAMGIVRNWMHPVDLTDVDPVPRSYLRQCVDKLLPTVLRLEDVDWRNQFAKLPGPTRLVDLAARLPLVRHRLIVGYTVGRLLHDMVVLRLIEAPGKPQLYLDAFVIDYANYRAIRGALNYPQDDEAAVMATIAAEAVEMLAALQIRDRSTVFPLDYISTSQLLKDSRLAAQVARHGAFDDLITEPAGYMIKRAPVIRVAREDASAEQMLELPHPIHFFIDAIAKDIPAKTAFVDFTVSAGGVCTIAVMANGKFGAAIGRSELRGRSRDIVSGQIRQLRRCATSAVDPLVTPPRDGSPAAKALWHETTLVYGFRLDEAGALRLFAGDHATYISRAEWQADLRSMFDVLMGKLLPLLDKLGIEHIVINPDRSLNLLPFALLTSPDGTFLFDQKAISLVPTLPHFINALLRINLDPDRVLACVVILVDTHSGAAHFAVEQRLVTAAFSGRDVVVHTTDAFDAAAFVRDAQRADVIHVCTHASFDARQPTSCGIQIGDDRWFDLRQIEALQLRRNALVFLGACETGTLDVSDRFNRASIAESFLSAGAGSVIATHWKVDGRAMALLASRFYALLLALDGPGTLQSLRAAQSWLRACSKDSASAILGQRILTNVATPYADDFFWSAVALWGSWI